MDKLFILHLEDNPDDVYFVKRFLEREHIPADCVNVASREEFLDGLARQPALILSDRNLPGFSGDEALALAREKLPATPFVVLTGMVRDEDAKACLQAGARGYFSKQQLWQLLPILRAVGEDGAAATPPAPLAGMAALEQLVTELENRVRLRTAQLEEANRELEIFSYSVAHDLRSPLTNIGLYAQLVLEEGRDALNRTLVEHLERVSAETERMNGLIEDLLRLASYMNAELQAEEVNLSAMAADIVKHLRAREPGRRAEIQIADGLWALGDADLLKIVLENLLHNAWKYTANREMARITFDQSTNAAGEQGFRVCDNGVGFAMSQADKLFVPFQRLHNPRDFKGAGLGLATVQRIIRRHGGKIRAEAAVDAGATFHFSLPWVS